MERLTYLQARVLSVVRRRYYDQGEAPTGPEVGLAVGISKQHARMVLAALVRKGFLVQPVPWKRRGIQPPDPDGLGPRRMKRRRREYATAISSSECGAPS